MTPTRDKTSSRFSKNNFFFSAKSFGFLIFEVCSYFFFVGGERTNKFGPTDYLWSKGWYCSVLQTRLSKKKKGELSRGSLHDANSWQTFWIKTKQTEISSTLCPKMWSCRIATSFWDGKSFLPEKSALFPGNLWCKFQGITNWMALNPAALIFVSLSAQSPSGTRK